MDDLNTMGLSLPSPAYLFGALIFSIIGFAAYRYGKKMEQRSTKWLGVTLMLYSYVVPQTWMLYLVGCGLCGVLYASRK